MSFGGFDCSVIPDRSDLFYRKISNPLYVKLISGYILHGVYFEFSDNQGAGEFKWNGHILDERFIESWGYDSVLVDFERSD